MTNVWNETVLAHYLFIYHPSTRPFVRRMQLPDEAKLVSGPVYFAKFLPGR